MEHEVGESDKVLVLTEIPDGTCMSVFNTEIRPVVRGRLDTAPGNHRAHGKTHAEKNEFLVHSAYPQSEW
ncbi:hypothetical protein [Streptomyces sp. NBC_00151]|uniref:hypothetical protein n=1 Tax=Streptomyces sp. NBC_00151 TaxID=2975669 RepID=UPI002DD85ED9|nr:hypothetical protein [Streptomyces sp. NBC_00151]WRZ41769.1 hypothetical protein OG915_29260 [Streptomyces sp. NBC_00151]